MAIIVTIVFCCLIGIGMAAHLSENQYNILFLMADQVWLAPAALTAHDRRPGRMRWALTVAKAPSRPTSTASLPRACARGTPTPPLQRARLPAPQS